ncbi:TauD/TfdA family dioxygenase [Inquilinus limosus]|uniref:TauD/TfdA dioxygenase family protein n=1 Tax=Inquilinus limosus TaxID=171674 RepID=UPI003F136EF3
MSAFTTRPLSDLLGVEITGLDLATAPDEATFARVKTLFEVHSLVVFRDQRITPQQHIDFSRRFGELEIHVQHHFHLAGHPEILIVSNEMRDGKPIGLADAGRYWHSDLSYKAEPSLGSLLHAQTLPPVEGDTLFVSMAAAYDALDGETKVQIETLTAVHDYSARNVAQQAKSSLRPGLTAEQARTVPPVTHPVVRIHPATGRKALFVNEGFTTHIVELERPKSDALLRRLFEHMIQPRFQYRHRWQPHDLVFWDNRATIHLATGCPPHLARTLYRTTVKGDRPIGPRDRAAA